MKKFYTLLAAAAVAFGASAVAPKAFMAEKVANNVNKTMRMEAKADAQDVSLSQVGNLPVVKRSVKAPIGGGPALETLYGFYSQQYYNAVQNGGWMGPVQCAINPTNEENAVTIDGFLMGAGDDNRFLNSIPAVYNKSAATLTVKNGVNLGKMTVSGQPVDVYLYIQGWDSEAVLDKDIVFKYSAAEHGFVYSGRDASGMPVENLVLTDNSTATVGTVIDRAFAFITDMNLNSFNGIMVQTFSTSSGQQEQGEYVYYETFDNSILLYNIQNLGFNQVVEMAVDKTAKTAALNQQTLVVDFGTANGGEKTMVFASESGGNLVPTVTFNGETTTDEDGVATTFTNNGYYLIDSEGFGFNVVKSEIMLIDADFFGAAAIKNVTADFDENSPVEYFNLQGVRVENPANGLFIKRQGNKVAKVVL